MGRHWTVIPFWIELNYVYPSITAMSQGVCDLDRSLKVSALNPQKFLMSDDLQPSFLPKRQFPNEKIWWSETKLWLKVNFSQHVQGYSETSFWFVHATDIYCSVSKNLRKFKVSFSSRKISLCSKVAPFWWGDFEQLWLHLFDRNTCTMKQLFSHSEKRGCGGLSL